jgi:hypothetical protein
MPFADWRLDQKEEMKLGRKNATLLGPPHHMPKGHCAAVEEELPGTVSDCLTQKLGMQMGPGDRHCECPVRQMILGETPASTLLHSTN